MKRTIVSTAIVGLSLAANGSSFRHNNQLDFANRLVKVGHFHKERSKAIDGVIKTAADAGRIIAADQDNDELGFKKDMEKAGHFYEKHSGVINGAITTAAKIGKMFADENENENELGFKQDMKKAGHFYEKHSGAINGAITTAAKIGKMFADENENENENELGFKSFMHEVGHEIKEGAEHVGHFYENHQDTIDEAVITAAKAGKTLAGDQNEDDELSFKSFMRKIGKDLKKVGKKAGHFYEDHSGAINSAITTAASVGKKIAGDQNDDNELGFKNDMKKAGHFYEEHSGAINGAITTAAKIGKMFADENEDELNALEVNDYLMNENSLSTLKGLRNDAHEVDYTRKFLAF